MVLFDTNQTPLMWLTGEDPVTWIIEYEVERHWTQLNPPNLMGPTISDRGERSILSAMEELALLLSRNQDYLVFRKKPDPHFLSYLQNHGLGRGTILSLDTEDTNSDICELICGYPEILRLLQKIHREEPRTKFLFYGATKWSDRLMALTRISSLSAGWKTTEKVNSKLFSAKINGNYPKIPSEIATTREMLSQIGHRYLEQNGESPFSGVVLKDPMGVSGRGLRIVQQKAEMESYLNYLNQRGIKFKAVLIEKYVRKQGDINYQFFLHPKGNIQYYLYKEAILDGQKHRGHFTSCLQDRERNILFNSVSTAVGSYLARNGYFGCVGIDAVIAENGIIFPLLEINARLNNSSFQWSLDQLREYGKCFLVNQHSCVVRQQVDFSDFEETVFSKIPQNLKENIFLLSWAPIARLTHFPTKTRINYAVAGSTKEECFLGQEIFTQKLNEFFR